MCLTKEIEGGIRPIFFWGGGEGWGRDDNIYRRGKVHGETQKIHQK